MKNYLIFVILLSFCCNTLNKNINISSKNLEDQFIELKIIENNNIREKQLKNNIKIIYKNTDFKNKVYIFFCLNSPFIYLDNTNFLYEKIVLKYIKNFLINSLSPNISNNLIINVFQDKNISYIQLIIDKKKFNEIILKFIDTILISNFDINILNNSIFEVIKEEYNKRKNFDTNIKELLENKLFNSDFADIELTLSKMLNKQIEIDKIRDYYNNYFIGNRIYFFIFNKKIDFSIRNNLIKKLESFIPVERIKINKKEFNILFQDITNKIVFFDKNINNININLIFNSPSFNSKDYFSYKLSELIFNYNTKILMPKRTLINLNDNFINDINYSSISFLTNKENIIFDIYSIKNIIEKSKEGKGIFYYLNKQTNNIVYNYKDFNDSLFISIPYSDFIEKMKIELYKLYNFNEINENNIINYIKIYIYLDKEVDNENIKNKIFSITNEQIIDCYKKYFSNFYWGILSNKKDIERISLDIFF